MNSTDQFVDAIADAVVRKLRAEMPAGGGADARLMPVDVAAKYMGRSKSSVRGLIASGDIPQAVVKRIGSRVFLLKKELDAWISAQ